ncbi:hypothetical protein HO133_005232 [Letharia lupina]|uniref:Transcriptional regulator n=1 Tax=Letharia lupina TaxID=560253 RepID=A0A8H6C9Z8_9LECA|nr:uncharacterized protein HO133_005232 [Letharia lupina]KAF6219406.1 hypothetical protein HO133_005232 [Letharia lupina]
MSESSLSDGAPSEVVLEQALRNAVREVYRSGDLDQLTVKRIRKFVETDLDLQDDFFKNDPAWKGKSRNLIQSEVDSQADANANGEQPSSIPSPRAPPKSKRAQSNLPKPQKPNRDFRGTKRASSEKAGPNKRQKKETLDPEGSDSEEKEAPRKKPIPKPKKRACSEKTGPKERHQEEISDLDGPGSEEQEVLSTKPVSKLGKSTSSPSPEPETIEKADQISNHISGNSKANGKKAEASESEMSEVLDEAPKRKGRKRKSGSAKPSASTNGAKADASDSEMSEVLDEARKAKGQKRKSDSAKPSAKKTETLKRKKSSEQSTDPGAEEIKRLQGWLIKCGIRKMWHKELAPYDNSKAKIVHLKKLLADAGMTGRYSVEKANQIKDERELRADLEAVQEGAKQWGKAEAEGEDETSGRPKRRLARGLQELAFLNDDDGEETD